MHNNPFILENEDAYLTWRDKKLANYPKKLADLIVTIQDPFRLTEQERSALLARCRKANMVIYQIENQLTSKAALKALSAQLGLTEIDRTLSCEDEEGISALQVVTEGRSVEYIPYTNRAINWHTDGYYNNLDYQVHGLLLHCSRPAFQGGDNMLLDHEIAYIQLRDKNPDFITALFAMDAMTIPANVQEGIELRSENTGPVFSLETHSGKLHMRYTARAKNIRWKSDPILEAAITYLKEICASDSPYIFQHLLLPNQGLICNNVLHNRSGFTDSEDPDQQRLLYRIRFYNRITGT